MINYSTFPNESIFKRLLVLVLGVSSIHQIPAQQLVPIIKANSGKAFILDGDHVKINWTLNPKLKPDTYYINIPRKKTTVTLQTDLDKITFTTTYGKSFDFIVLLNGKDSCFTRIIAKEAPTTVLMQSTKKYPLTIPFTLIGSRVYFQAMLNAKHKVTIQFDLGAGGSCISNNASEKLQLLFNGKALVDNTQGVNEARVSSGNQMQLGDITWKGVPLIEVGNMKPHEDLIIGNGLFRNKIIEIDYDKMYLMVHDKLPAYAKAYKKQAVFYEQDRPKLKAHFSQHGINYAFWFLFDTGRDGTMLIGEDFTNKNQHWDSLNELQIINGKKIVRLDATIAGVEFKDIVTNAADPAKPQGRPTLFGNQLLNRFNVILDNKSGEIYLKLNTRINEPYSDYKSYLEEVSKK